MIQPKTLSKVLLSAVAGFALMAGAAMAEVESTDPIKFTQGDWTTIQLNTEIATRIMQKMGYNTEMVPTEYLAQLEAVKSGDVHAAMEIWFTTAEAQYNEAVASGKAADYGETGMQAKEEWWFPSYMKEQCPGLPDWKALNECAKLFATSETGEKGRYIMGPQSWGGYDEERVKALGLNWQVVYAGNDATLNAEVKSAYERKAPIMAWVYAPNWTTSVYKGEWVEFPKYEAACYSDPKWGGNAELAYDCGKPSGPIKKLGWSGLEGKWPKAAAALKKYTVDNETIGRLSLKVDVEGMAVADVAQAWVDENEAIWKPWTE
jgi:glycine betaine/proline transport system substrate-binding protein